MGEFVTDRLSVPVARRRIRLGFRLTSVLLLAVASLGGCQLHVFEHGLDGKGAPQDGLYGPPDNLATTPPGKVNWTSEEITGGIVALGTLGTIAHRHWFHRKGKSGT